MSSVSLNGSCLCGAVRYEVRGEPVRFYHCHCGRCRKASGTGHASNIMLKPGEVSWLQGEDRLVRYKVPEAERFATCFCSVCGSPLPREVPELGLAVIPAGSLDSLPPIRPQARIFWDSRVDWSCDAGDLPVFSEYPPSVG
jgi:hypothetical protein